MKTFNSILIGAILCLLLAGCYVQSLHPFYTKEKVMDFPKIVGDWKVIQHGERYIPYSEQIPWKFSKDSLEIVDDKGIRSRIKATYFKVGDAVFLDSTADDPDEHGGIGKYWVAHVYPVHMLCKVVVEGDTLTLMPLNYDWFEKNKEKLGKEIPYIEVDEPMMFTATSEQWISFLQKHKDTKEVFDQENAYILKQSKDSSKEDTPKK